MPRSTASLICNTQGRGLRYLYKAVQTASFAKPPLHRMTRKSVRTLTHAHFRFESQWSTYIEGRNTSRTWWILPPRLWRLSLAASLASLAFQDASRGGSIHSQMVIAFYHGCVQLFICQSFIPGHAFRNIWRSQAQCTSCGESLYHSPVLGQAKKKLWKLCLFLIK